MNYFESTVFSQYVYKQMKWTETDEYFEIRNVSEHITYCDDCSDWPVLPDIRVNITLPVSATEQDADEINKSSLKKNEIVMRKEKKTKKAFSFASKILIILIFLGILILIIKHLIKKYKKNKIEY